MYFLIPALFSSNIKTYGQKLLLPVKLYNVTCALHGCMQDFSKKIVFNLKTTITPPRLSVEIRDEFNMSGG